jgi:acetyltransferase-like isoleucine patch superfamily enzyme
MIFLKVLLSLPKTLILNFLVFPFKTAIRFPVLIGYDVKISRIYKNCITINSDISPFMIKINIVNGSDAINVANKRNGYLTVGKNGKLIFNGKANFSSGNSMEIYGTLIFGKNFSCNKNTFISCNKKIVIGDNNLFGWNVNIRDSDGHLVYNLNEKPDKSNIFEDVLIGNHVWLGANVDILKGVTIPDDCVVGYNSCVTKKFDEPNCLLAGYPAKKIKNSIGWQK